MQRAVNTRPRGFTLIELIVVLAIVALLVSIVAPRYFGSVERARENSLRSSLSVMRASIDQFAADKGRYPDSAEDLVRAGYLREMPQDPITGRRDSWVPVSPAADDFLAGGLADLRSGAAGRGADGRLYADW